MARLPMVTRTIITTMCNVLCMDVEHEEPCNKDITLSGVYTDKEKMLKAIKKQFEGTDIVPVRVVHSEEKETLYGMTEQEFIERASVLPPRGTKAPQTGQE